MHIYIYIYIYTHMCIYTTQIGTLHAEVLRLQSRSENKSVARSSVLPCARTSVLRTRQHTSGKNVAEPFPPNPSTAFFGCLAAWLARWQ